MIPSDHISHFVEYGFLARICGAIYNGDPTQDRNSWLEKLSTYLAKPKSAILYIPSWLNILAGLRSLWITVLLTNSLNPWLIYLNIFHESYSENFFLVINSRKSPSLQNSVMIYRLLYVEIKSINLTIFLWLNFFKISIS